AGRLIWFESPSDYIARPHRVHALGHNGARTPVTAPCADATFLHVMDGSVAGDYVPQPYSLRVPPAGECLNHAFEVPLGADDDQADSHVENTEHLVGRNAAPLLEETEQRRDLPRAPFDLGRAPFRQRTR